LPAAATPLPGPEHTSAPAAHDRIERPARRRVVDVALNEPHVRSSTHMKTGCPRHRRSYAWPGQALCPGAQDAPARLHRCQTRSQSRHQPSATSLLPATRNERWSCSVSMPTARVAVAPGTATARAPASPGPAALGHRAVGQQMAMPSAQPRTRPRDMLDAPDHLEHRGRHGTRPGLHHQPPLDDHRLRRKRGTGLGRRHDQETEFPLTQRRAQVHQNIAVHGQRGNGPVRGDR
jgi:hypothetical protein